MHLWQHINAGKGTTTTGNAPDPDDKGGEVAVSSRIQVPAALERMAHRAAEGTIPVARLHSYSLVASHEIRSAAISVHSSLESWKSLPVDPFVEQLLRRGVPVDFRSTPPPKFLLPSIPLSPEHTHFARKELPCRLLPGAMRPVPAVSVEYSSPVFVVVHPVSGKRRLVVDLRQINNYCLDYRCRYETLATVPTSALQNGWATRTDLEDAYHMFHIRPAERKYFTFRLFGVYWQYVVLPFGWSASPYYFTKLLRPVLKHLRRRGIRLVAYLDDLFLSFRSRRRARTLMALVIRLFDRLGLRINYRKSQLTPVQRLTFLGIDVDLRRGFSSYPPLVSPSSRKQPRPCYVLFDATCVPSIFSFFDVSPGSRYPRSQQLLPLV